MPDLRVLAELSEGCGGAARLLLDVDRFGYGLRSMTLQRSDGGTVQSDLLLTVPQAVDPGTVTARLARHPSVLALTVSPAQSAYEG